RLLHDFFRFVDFLILVLSRPASEPAERGQQRQRESLLPVHRPSSFSGLGRHEMIRASPAAILPDTRPTPSLPQEPAAPGNEVRKTGASAHHNPPNRTGEASQPVAHNDLGGDLAVSPPFVEERNRLAANQYIAVLMQVKQ